MQNVAEEYATQPLTVEPGDRLHRLVSLLFDTYYDDLTDERIQTLEAHVEAFRWCNASGQRVA